MFNNRDSRLERRSAAKLLTTLSLLAFTAMLMAQDETAEKTAESAPKTFPPDWWRFWDYDLLRWSFVAATLVASYGIGTMVFSAALNGSRPSRAGCMGWMVAGLAFVAIWIVIFALLIPMYIASMPSWITWVMWGVAILLLVLILLRLTRRS